MSYVIAGITWRPRIGDPNPLAWCITVAYFVACALCFFVARSQCAAAKGGKDSRLARFWFVLAALMFALGWNKQLDLQTLLTQCGREAARYFGWYQQRRPVQAVFVFACALLGMFVAVAGMRFLRNAWRQCGLSYLGAVLLLTFVVIRAASFHQIDVLLYHLPVVGYWMNTSLELSGILFVGLGALLAALQNRQGRLTPIIEERRQDKSKE